MKKEKSRKRDEGDRERPKQDYFNSFDKKINQ